MLPGLKNRQFEAAQLAKKNLLPVLLGLIVIVTIITQPYSEYLVLIIISIPVFLLSLYLMQETISAFNIERMTIPAFWFLTYLMMIYFPAFVVFYELEDPARYAYIFAVESVMVTVPLGILAVNKIYQLKKISTNRFFDAPIQESIPSIHKIIVYTIFLCFATSFALLYLGSLDKIPLFYMFQHAGESQQEFTALREESFKLLDPRWSGSSSTSIFYIYLFLRTLVFPLLVLVSLGYYLSSRDIKWLFLFIITFIVGIIYAGASIARAPVAAIILRILFFIYIFKKGRLGKIITLALMIFTLLVPVIITKMAYGNGIEFIEALKRVAIRLFYTPAADLYDYFEIFPYHHDYLYGQALLKPIRVALGMDYFYIENYVYQYRYPYGVETGHANAAFQSNLYADFGIVGVLLGGFFTGALMQGIQIYILRRRKTVINIAVYSFMIYAFWVLNSGSITSVLFVNGVIPLLFILLLFRGLEELSQYLLRKR